MDSLIHDDDDAVSLELQQVAVAMDVVGELAGEQLFMAKVGLGLGERWSTLVLLFLLFLFLVAVWMCGCVRIVAREDVQPIFYSICFSGNSGNNMG